MKKDNEQEQLFPTFEDADYQQSMRVDSLTTTEAIQNELKEIQKNRTQREKEKQQQDTNDPGLVASDSTPERSSRSEGNESPSETV